MKNYHEHTSPERIMRNKCAQLNTDEWLKFKERPDAETILFDKSNGNVLLLKYGDTGITQRLYDYVKNGMKFYGTKTDQ